MAINLASKYSKDIATAFTRESFVKGITSQRYDFTGVKTLKIYTPVTVDEGDYTRSGTSRYGEPVEVEDVIQELKMTQDKSFTLTIDKGNASDQLGVKKAGEILKLQIAEKSTPAADKYAIAQYIKFAGQTVTTAAAPTASTVLDSIADMQVAMSNALVPENNRYILIGNSLKKFIMLAPEFVGVDKLGEKALSKGVCGEAFGAKVIAVPDSYFPTGSFALMVHKDAIMMPYKIQDAKIHEDPVGVSGNMIEGRHYYDAFVLGAKCNGVVALVLAASVQTAPTAAITSHKATLTSAGADKILYTLDGSDPRYSGTAEVYTAPVTTEAGQTIRCVAMAPSGKFTSTVTDKTDA